MSPALEQQLFDKYPGMFKLTWGFECDDGWYNLLDELCLKIKESNPIVVQVKEKFGNLRFYTEAVEEQVNLLINEAEELSSTICEITGKPGALCQKGGWYKTLCEDSATILGYKKQ